MREHFAGSADNKTRTYTRRAFLAATGISMGGLMYAAGKGAVELGKEIDKKLSAPPTPSTYTGLREGDHLEWAQIYTTNDGNNGPANIHFEPSFTTDNGEDTTIGKAEVGTVMHAAAVVAGQDGTPINWVEFDCNKVSRPITNDKGTPETLSDKAQCYVVAQFVKDVSGN